MLVITLPQKRKERLERLALNYGLSLAEFSSRILEEITSEFPEESFKDYENPKSLKRSLNRALSDKETN